jgi:hypothetical protein
MPNVDAFIMKRTATYLGKISRLNSDSLPKKFLAAWISGSRKNGAPQLTCNNNFTEAINKILPLDKSLSSGTAPLKEWLPLAIDERNWQNYIDKYFELCHNNDYQEEPKSAEP